MSHIFAEDGEGESEDDLTMAITSAIQNALGQHKFSGDHLYSMSVMVVGYDFDGKKYHVKVKVFIFDFELAKEDYYKEIEKFAKQRHDQDDALHHYYMAVYGGQHRHHYHDEFFEQFRDNMDHINDVSHIHDIHLIASLDVHNQIAIDFGHHPELQTPLPRVHAALETLTLGPGHGSGSWDSDKAA